MTAAPSTAEDWVLTAARVRASILHPHLLRARYEGPPSGGVRMELCMSPTLAETLDGGPLEMRDAVAMVDDLASAMDALAARGLAPRQLSPHSIHLHHRRGAVLADAGVPATVVPRLEVVSQRARQYISPEEVAGHRATRRSLVYTLGAILRESVSYEAPAALGDVIERATADSPGSRYAHPRAFASAAVAAAIGVGAVPANGARPRPASRVARAAGRKAPAAHTREPRRDLATVARSALETALETARTIAARMAAVAAQTAAVAARTAAAAARTAAVAARAVAATGGAAVAATRTLPQRAGTAARTGAAAAAAAAVAGRRAAAAATVAGRRAAAAARPIMVRAARMAVEAARASAAAARVAVAAAGAAGRSLMLAVASVFRRILRGGAAVTASGASAGAASIRSSGRAAQGLGHRARRGAPAATRAVSARVPRPRLSKRTAAVALGVFAVTALAAVAISLGADEPARTELRSAHVRVAVPAAWHSDSAPHLRGLSLAGDVAASDSRHAGHQLVAGMARSHAQVARLVRHARTTAGVPASTRLGAIQAWTWNGVQVAGAPARLYVGYTSSGPLVAICRGGTGGRTCSALDTLELSGPRPVPLAAVEAIRTKLRSTLATLHTRWIQGRERLAGAPVASKQAAAARALERTFTTASSALSEISTPRGTTDLTLVVSVLDDIAGSYRDLAQAIEADDRASFGAARQAITASEARVRPVVAAASIP